MPSRLIVFVLLFVPAVAVPAPPAVAELFEDDAAGLLAQLSHGGISGGEGNRAAAEDADVFSGKRAVRVAALQRFSPDVKGWDFAIAEKPKPGEYRYLRFAWKKDGAGPLMLQFHTRRPGRDWYIRYYMGQDGPPWESKVLRNSTPAEWVVVTRDLFQDFGAVSLGGMALTPLSGGDGLFDHILLGRTRDDLDQATTAALTKTPPKRPLSERRLKQFWTDLGSPDEITSQTAVWALVAGHKEAVAYLSKAAVFTERKPAKPIDAAAVKPLIDQLGHYRHVNRLAAAEKLYALGDGAIPHVRKAADGMDGEQKSRVRAVLDEWMLRTEFSDLRLLRAAAVLTFVGTPEAKEVLQRIQKALP